MAESGFKDTIEAIKFKIGRKPKNWKEYVKILEDMTSDVMLAQKNAEQKVNDKLEKLWKKGHG